MILGISDVPANETGEGEANDTQTTISDQRDGKTQREADQLLNGTQSCWNREIQSGEGIKYTPARLQDHTEGERVKATLSRGGSLLRHE